MLYIHFFCAKEEPGPSKDFYFSLAVRSLVLNRKFPEIFTIKIFARILSPSFLSLPPSPPSFLVSFCLTLCSVFSFSPRFSPACLLPVSVRPCFITSLPFFLWFHLPNSSVSEIILLLLTFDLQAPALLNLELNVEGLRWTKCFFLAQEKNLSSQDLEQWSGSQPGGAGSSQLSRASFQIPRMCPSS